MAGTESEPAAAEKKVSFARLIGTSMGAKFLLDTSSQIFSPFLEIIAQGLGVSIVVLGQLLGLRSAMGLLAPLFGVQADRYGYRRIIRLGLLLTALGTLLIGLSSGIWLLAAGMILSGLGMSSFVPTLHAYLSAQLPYSQRARGLGMVEYSWALTGIVGLFLMGLVIERSGWRTPFFLLAAGLAVMSVVMGTLPVVRGRAAVHAEERSGSLWRRLWDFFHLGAGMRSTYATIAVGAFSYFAAMQIMIMYGAWLGQEYGLSAAQLGTVALLLGCFDLAASVSVSLFTDRIGKRRSVLIGNLGALMGYLLMPWLNVTAALAVLGIAVARSSFEFSIVSNFPLLSEQAPDQRGKVMTLGVAVSLTGATVASFTGPPLYARLGVHGLASVSAAAVFVALLILVTLVHERGQEG